MRGDITFGEIFNDCACCHRVDRKNSGHQVDLLLKIFWLSLDCFGSLHRQGWNQDAALADAQSECCVKFIFIVLCHFMMSWGTAHPLPCQRYNIVSTFPGAFNFDPSRVIKVQMVKHWVVSAVECNQEAAVLLHIEINKLQSEQNRTRSFFQWPNIDDFKCPFVAPTLLYSTLINPCSIARWMDRSGMGRDLGARSTCNTFTHN